MLYRSPIGRAASVLVLFSVLLFCGGASSCDKKNQAANGNANAGELLSTKRIDELAKWSRELAHDTGLGIDAVALLYRTGKISLERKDTLAEGFAKVATAGRSFNSFVSRLSEQERAGTLPANWKELVAHEWGGLLDLYRSLTSHVAELEPAARAELQTSSSKLDERIEQLKTAIAAQ